MKISIKTHGKSKADAEEALYKALRRKRAVRHAHPFPDPYAERLSNEVKKAHEIMMKELMSDIAKILEKK